MTADTLDRARAVLAELRNADMEREPWLLVADMAAGALAVVGTPYIVAGWPWWQEEDTEGSCVGCQRWIGLDQQHADGCAAMVLEAAIRRLAGDA